MASLLWAFGTGMGDWDFYVALSIHLLLHSTKGYSIAEALSHSQCHCLQAQYAKPVPFPIFRVLKKEKHFFVAFSNGCCDQARIYKSIQATWTSYEAEALSQAGEFYT
ncbi:hypothetical protein PS1_038677 [Malus domestica]